MQHFERNQSLMLHVLSEVDRCHSAATELPVDRVILRQRPAESFDWKRSCHIPSRIALNRGLSRMGSKSESCSSQSLCPYPLSTACSRALSASSSCPRTEYVHATL